MITKNRERSAYSFANINLLGKCNLNCFFCLGKDLESEFSKYDFAHTHFSYFRHLNEFLVKCKDKNIKQIYITGQNVDPLQYDFLNEFRQHLQSRGFYVGLRTNGILACTNMDIINKFTTCTGDAVGYTLLTLDWCKMFLMTKTKFTPNWLYIFNYTKVPFRVSIVVTKYNCKDIMRLIQFISCFSFNENLKYIQLRRICTDVREEQLQEHIHAFDEAKIFLENKYPLAGTYETAPRYKIFGTEVILWETTATTANSMNYFCNGVISDEYFIIEGYLKNLSRIL